MSNESQEKAYYEPLVLGTNEQKLCIVPFDEYLLFIQVIHRKEGWRIYELLEGYGELLEQMLQCLNDLKQNAPEGAKGNDSIPGNFMIGNLNVGLHYRLQFSEIDTTINKIKSRSDLQAFNKARLRYYGSDCTPLRFVTSMSFGTVDLEPHKPYHYSYTTSVKIGYVGRGLEKRNGLILERECICGARWTEYDPQGELDEVLHQWEGTLMHASHARGRMGFKEDVL